MVVFLVWGFELVLLLLLLPFAVLARTYFGKHWTVEVWHGGNLVREVDGGDFRASGETAARLAAEIERGAWPGSDTQPWSEA